MAGTIIAYRSHLFTGVLLVIVVGLVYGGSMFNGFVWDDHEIVVKSTMNRDLSNIRTFFTSADSTLSGKQKLYYRPLNRLTYMLDYHLFGLNPAYYHLENIVIHILTVLLLYMLALRLFGETAPAFFAALVFAVHPVNAEAVNFISGRNSLLVAFFVLMSVTVYGAAQASQKKAYYVLAGALFFMGLLCKETALMLIVVLFFYDLSPSPGFTRKFKKKLFPLAPFAVFALIYLLLRMNALSGPIVPGQGLQGIWQRLLPDLFIIPRYVMLLLFPVKLNALYYVPADYLSAKGALVFIWVAIFSALSVLCYFSRGRSVLGFGLLWIAVNFVPISQIVPVPSASMAERYLYLPAIGAWLLAADLWRGLYLKPSFGKFAAVIGAGVLICFGALTIDRNPVWRDDVALFSSVVKEDPGSVLAHFNLGLAYRQKKDLLKALPEWEKTVAIDPDYLNVSALLGELYVMLHMYDRAEYYYSYAVESNPDNMEALYNLAVLKERLNKPGEALMYYEAFAAKASSQSAAFLPRVRTRIYVLRKELNLPR